MKNYDILKNPSIHDFINFRKVIAGSNPIRGTVLNTGDVYFYNGYDLLHNEAIGVLVDRGICNYDEEIMRVLTYDGSLFFIVVNATEEQEDEIIQKPEVAIKKEFEEKKKIFLNLPYIRNTFPNCNVVMELRDEEAEYFVESQINEVLRIAGVNTNI